MEQLGADELFEDYLRRRQAGEPVDFEELCAAHPEAEEELRAHKRRFDDFGDLLGGDSSARLVPGALVAEKYELERLLGKGGFGQVWLAKQHPSGQQVALKLVRYDELDLEYAEDIRRRFSSEAVAMGRARHAGIVAMLDSGRDGELGWIALEYMEGGDLHAQLVAARQEQDAGRLPPEYDRSVAELVAKVCDALQVVHEKKIVHRDLKPQNILMDRDNQPKVADFGLARIADMTLSRSGTLVGTFYYMSPEQVLTSSVAALDHRSDIFSLGVVLYEMLAFSRPFGGDTTHQIADQIVNRDPPDPRTLRSRAPLELCLIAAKAMEKEPERRYQSMAEFAADLRRHLAHEPIHAQAPSFSRKVGKWCRRHPVAASVASLVTTSLVVISVLAVLLRFERDEKERQRNLAIEQRDLAETRRLGLLQPAVEALVALDDEERQPGATTPSSIEGLRQWLSVADAYTVDSPEAPNFERIASDIAKLRDGASGSNPASGEVGTPLEEARYWLGQARLQHEWLRQLIGRAPLADPSADLARLQDLGRLPADLADVDGVLEACEGVLGGMPGQGASTIFLSDRSDMAALHEAAILALANHDERPLEERRVGERHCRLQRAIWWLACARGLVADMEPMRLKEDLSRIRVDSLCRADRLGVWEREAFDVLETAEIVRRLRLDGAVSIDRAERDVALLSSVENLLARDWTFVDPADQRLHDGLVQACTRVAKFQVGFMGGSGGGGWSWVGRPAARERLRLALEARAVDETPEVELLWMRVLDSVHGSGLYAKAAWPGGGGLRRQPGLRPLGPDPVSGLEEFAVTGTGQIPVRDEGRSIRPEPSQAIVLVLLPGGPSRQVYHRGNGFTVDVIARSCERTALFFERSHIVAPYFISKFELTRAQWGRLASDAVLSSRPDAWRGPPLLPVTLVDRLDALTVLAQAGLSLPTIAEWDLAAFADAESPYLCDDPPLCLEQHANLSDQSRTNLEDLASSAGEPWDDRHPRLAPVGFYSPNVRGLHDIAGNVGEWCLDRLSSELHGHHLHAQWDEGATMARLDGELGVVKGGSWANFRQQCLQGRSLHPYVTEVTDTTGIRPVWRLR